MSGNGVVGVVALALALAAGPLAAQERRATPPVDLDHWAYEAVERLAAAGLVEGAWSGQRPLSVGAIREALRDGAEHASREASPLAVFARRAVAQFAEEYPSSGTGEEPAGLRTRAQANVRAGQVEVADGADRTLDVGMELAASLGRHLALQARPTAQVSRTGEVTLREARVSVVGKLEPWWASLGHQRMAFGPGTCGVVLNGSATFRGLMLGTDRPVDVPGVGRWTGPVHVTVFVTDLGGGFSGDDVLFGAMRVAFAPHPRLRVGLNRTVLVDTEVYGRRIRPKELLYVAIGKHNEPNVADHRASVDLALLLGGRGWRLMPYLEWGFEDTAGAYIEDPALSVGAYLPFVPGVPGLSLRYEYTGFGESARVCWFCVPSSRSWYRHGAVRPTYQGANGALIGHPLGGYGYEHRLEAETWFDGARVHVQGSVVRRERRKRNLLYESRPGRSHGVGLRSVVRVAPELSLSADLWWEVGEAGWHERSAWLTTRLFF